MLPRFDVLQPESVKEACELLDRYASEGVAVLAGGTDILVDIRRPIIPAHLPRCKGCNPKTGMPLKSQEKAPAYLVALSRIPGLSGITEEENGDIVIGPMTTITEICNSKLIRDKLTALAEGGDNLGSPLVRNRGTLGGNICNARPAADALLPSVALNAQCVLQSIQDTRKVPVEEFVVAPGETVLEKGEILTKIVFPSLPEHSGSSCIKLANRKALEIAVVNVASVVTLDDKGKIVGARIALGSVAPTPVVAKKAGDYLKGKEQAAAVFDEAGKIAANECRPITDHRGSAIYRVDMAHVLVSKILSRSVSAA
jgi:carbon-monoxide dehydrogenase medium subunit